MANNDRMIRDADGREFPAYQAPDLRKPAADPAAPIVTVQVVPERRCILIGGQDIEQLTDDQLLDIIRRLEADIDAMQVIRNKPLILTKRMDDAAAQIGIIVGWMNSRR